MIPDKLWSKVDRWLKLRPHSQMEIELYLKRRVKKWVGMFRFQLEGMTADELFGKLLGQIEKLGYANDEKFASWWTDQRVEFRRFGSQRIRSELLQKGVSTEIVRKTMQEQVLRIEPELAKEWVDKVKYKHPEWDKSKTLRYLASKGLPYSLVGELLNSRDE